MRILDYSKQLSGRQGTETVRKTEERERCLRKKKIKSKREKQGKRLKDVSFFFL